MGITVYCLGKKALDALEGLSEASRSIVDCLVIGEDKNIGDDCSEAITAWARQHHIPAVERKLFSGATSTSIYHVAIGWRWIIRVNPGAKVIILHDSLLPKYRGFNPLVTALINGDTTIGVSAIFGEDEFDKGDIIAQESISIKYPITISEAIAGVSALYRTILSAICEKLAHGSQLQVAFHQDESQVTYSVWRDEEDYRIHWEHDAERIRRFIDAVGFPYKGAFTFYKGEKIRIHAVSVEPDVTIANRDAGKNLFKKDGMPVIICGKGLLKIIDAQTENGEKITFENQFRIRLE